jgi:hypothetical protein
MNVPKWGFLLLTSCAQPNPNANVYNWHLPPPDPVGRSFLGYDPDYEQRLLDRYIATHKVQIQQFRVDQGWAQHEEERP